MTEKRGSYAKMPKTHWRTLVDTYYYVSARLEKVGDLSLRKQFCMAYLKWGLTGKREDREIFVELGKQWRKADNKLGAHRSKLEKIARKFYRSAKRLKSNKPVKEAAKEWGKKAAEEGIGFLTKDPEKLAEINRKRAETYRRNKELGKHKETGKEFIVIDPEGNVYRIRGLAKFCKEMGLDDRHMFQTAKYPNQHHKGWRCQYVAPGWKDLMHGTDDEN